LLSLGGYGLDRLSQAQRENLIPRLLQLYRDDPDPGVHGVAEWLLRQWEMAGPIQGIDKALATGKVEGKRQWYINRQGQTMMVIANAGEFWMGDEFWMGERTVRHRQRIGRSFAIASKEVTVEQFLKFRKEYEIRKLFSRTSDSPVINVTWYEAAAYCNWLNEQEGIPKDQWCYEPNQEGKYAEGMKMASNCLQRKGYRLPTDAEWEYACRARAETGFSCGEGEALLGKYAWYGANSQARTQPVGKLRPNDLGLFDMHGNAGEWCQSIYKPDVAGEKAVEDINDSVVANNKDRVWRGGSFNMQAPLLRSGIRLRFVPSRPLQYIGFRAARTFTP
jgi:formylglycine-generating enzyme required for sulfatase activity